MNEVYHPPKRTQFSNYKKILRNIERQKITKVNYENS